MKKRFLLLILTLLLSFGLVACSTANVDTNADKGSNTDNNSEEKSIETVTKGVLTVGFDQNFPPMGFIGDDGEFTGFDIELAKETAKRLNLEIKLQPIDWNAKDMELSTKNIDCIWNGFTINGRENDYTWTKPYMANKQVFVVRADSTIKSSADLAGKTVVVQADSSAETALNDKPELVKTFGKYMTAADYNTALLDLEAGAVDAVAMDDTVASYHIEKKGSKFKILDEIISVEDYGVGFLLGNESLRDTIQKTLEEMAADGTMKTISEKWFGKDITTIGK